MAGRLKLRPGDGVFHAPRGTRRAWLGRIGHDRGAEITDAQARLLGGIQYDLVVRDHLGAAAALRELAPTDARLRVALSRDC